MKHSMARRAGPWTAASDPFGEVGGLVVEPGAHAQDRRRMCREKVEKKRVKATPHRGRITNAVRRVATSGSSAVQRVGGHPMAVPAVSWRAVSGGSLQSRRLRNRALEVHHEYGFGYADANTDAYGLPRCLRRADRAPGAGADT